MYAKLHFPLGPWKSRKHIVTITSNLLYCTLEQNYLTVVAVVGFWQREQKIPEAKSFILCEFLAKLHLNHVLSSN